MSSEEGPDVGHAGTGSAPRTIRTSCPDQAQVEHATDGEGAQDETLVVVPYRRQRPNAEAGMEASTQAYGSTHQEATTSMGVPGHVIDLAQKYAPEVADVTTPVVYKDATVERGAVVVKTETMADDLHGFIAWRTLVNAKGKCGKPQAEIWKALRPSEFMTWAKLQSVKTLQALLRGQGIQTDGTVTYILAARLTYCAEEVYFKGLNAWPLPSEKMEQRARVIDAHMRFLDLKGVENEAAIMKVRNFLDHGTQPQARETGMPTPAAETPAQIRKRLLDESQSADAQDEKSDKSEKGKDAAETPARGRRGRGSEVDAIKAGKKGATDDATTTNDTAPAESGEKETDVTTKKKGAKSKGGSKAAKSAKKPAVAKASAESKSDSGMSQKDLPVGSKVKYIGTRVKHHVGKTAEVVAHRGPKGVVLKFSDGLVGSAMANQVEKIKK